MEQVDTLLESEMPTFQQAMAEGDCETALIFAGEVVDLIDAVEPAAELVQRIGVEAEARRTGIARLAPGIVSCPADAADSPGGNHQP